LLKYGLGLALLAMVIPYWHLSAGGQGLPAVAAATSALIASPLGHGPVLAGSSLYPGRAEGHEVGLAGVLQRPIHWHFLALAAAITLASVLLTFVRWYVLVRAQALPFRLVDALRLGMIGYYLNTFLPGAVG